ncbi:hypothetical protein Tco_1299064, partial [Tanacetum coccineum]
LLWSFGIAILLFYSLVPTKFKHIHILKLSAFNLSNEVKKDATSFILSSQEEYPTKSGTIISNYKEALCCLPFWRATHVWSFLKTLEDSDYAGANLDRKSTTGGCQFLRSRLISWQCKKQTIVATSTTEAEYVAAASCCGQVLWIQNQMLDYGFNFMNTKIHIDNESTICIVKNHVCNTPKMGRGGIRISGACCFSDQ